MIAKNLESRAGALVATALALTLIACGGAPKPTAEDSAAQEAAAIAAERAQLEQRAAELAEREAALATEQATAAAAAQAEADAAAAQAAADKAAADKAAAAAKAEAARLTAAKRDAESKPAQPSPAAAPPKAARPVVVPSGTALPIAFTSTVTTKTAKVGDPIAARLTEALVIDGRQVAPAGAAVTGVVSEVFSGSREIGGTPRLGLRFEQLSLGNGRTVAIAGTIAQEGKRESGRDAAKIAGGAVLGAVLGKQVDNDKGAVIGGLLGGAAGAAIAKNTGSDLEIADGTAASLVLNRSFEVK